MSSFQMFRCFQDGMVLQRNAEVNVWGFTNAGTEVKLDFLCKEYLTVTNEHGEFIFNIKTPDAGGPYEMVVTSNNESINIKDILIGDVYIISGQSNMQLTNARTIDLLGERLESIDYPMIREFRVPEQIKFGAQDKQFPECTWLKAVGRDILEMSAAGFNFAENIYNNHNIPIGLINNSIGGTHIEAHLPEELLRTYNTYNEVMDKCKDDGYIKDVLDYESAMMENWYAELAESDSGIVNNEPVYAFCDIDDSSWNEIEIPCFLGGSDLEGYHGSVWFRHEFYMPEDYKMEGALLRLGVPIDGDETFLNGVMIGKTDYRYPPRRYVIPDGLLKAGRNVITLRLIINRDTGGFTMDKRYCLQGSEYIYKGGYRGTAGMPEDAQPDKGIWEINVAGTWKYKKGASLDVLPPQTFFQYKPSALYNGMMHPLLKYSFRGGLWYQGESNDKPPTGYTGLLRDLIRCWRRWFGTDMPFMYVQLPSYDDPAHIIDGDSWAIIREEQRRALEMPNTAMVVTIDKGESNDLHPQTKEIIGKRLALAAEHLIYGSKDEYSGPLPDNITYDAEENMIYIELSHCTGGLKLVNDNYDYFEVGYVDSNGYTDMEVYDSSIEWKKAGIVKIISDNKMGVVPATLDKNPAALRYAWSCAPDNPPVYNGVNLPATPFAMMLNKEI